MTALPGAIVAAFAVLGGGTALNVAAVMLPARRDEGGWGARIAAGAMTSLVLVLPFLLDGPPFFTALVAQSLIVETWRVYEILRTPARYSRRERAARIVLFFYEYTFLERTPRRLPVRDLVLSTLVLACGAALFIGASKLSPPVTPYTLRGWPRW